MTQFKKYYVGYPFLYRGDKWYPIKYMSGKLSISQYVEYFKSKEEGEEYAFKMNSNEYLVKS